MGIKQYKPTSAGRRGGSVSDFADCTFPGVNKPEKSLLSPIKKSGGRNHHGITTTRFRGGGHKRMYRQIDFKRKRDGVEATVISVEYDPNRSARIALIEYPKDEKYDNAKSYILAPLGMKAGDKVISGDGESGIELRPYQVLMKPLVTEKGTHQSTRYYAYTFQVNPLATKDQIKAAVEALFPVRVEAVRTQNRHGKKRRFKQTMGNLPDWKKAVVTLNKEDKIEFF